MSYVDNGDDELDYEDEDYPEPEQPYGHAQGATAALAEDEMEEEEGYEDLYEDVDVGFFENPEAAGGAQGAGEGPFPSSEQNGVVDDYGEDEYEENYEGEGGDRSRVIEEESYPAEGQEYGDEEQSADNVQNVRATTEEEDFEQPEDYTEEEAAAVDVALEQQQLQQPKGEEADGLEVDDPIPEDMQEDELADPLGVDEAESKQVEHVEVGRRPVEYGARPSTGSAGVGPAVVKIEEIDYGEQDAQVGRGVGAVTALLKPKIEVEQQRTEPQVGKSSADRGGSKSVAWANGSGPSSGEGVGSGKGGVRGDGGAPSGPWPATSGGGRGGGSGPASSGAAVAMAAPPAAASREPASGVANEYSAKHAVGGSHQQHEAGGIMLFVGELHWWTTDAELEAALSEYGRVRNLKFFEEKASGRSKGYCQVEFYDAGAARVCKEKMDGRVFNDRACVVAFASPQSIKQMGAAQLGKNQSQSQQYGSGGGQGRGRGESGSGGRGVSNSQMGGDGGRGYGGREKMSMGGRSGGPGGERGRGPGRGGRGGNVGGRGGGAHFGQGPPGPMGGPGGMMPPQGMMGGGFDPGFGPPMGGRGGYGMGPGGPGGGFGPRGHPFGPGMGPPLPNMGPGLPGVAPHVNPAFFGRANGNGPGIGMDGPAGGWGEGPMPGWVGDEHERRMVYGDEMGGPDYGYPGEMGPDRLRAGPARGERERLVEGEWAGVDRRRREDRGDGEWAGERPHRDRGSRDEYWDREQGRDKEKDWQDRERVPRGREKARAAPADEEERPRSRDEDFGKRRRMVADRKIER